MAIQVGFQGFPGFPAPFDFQKFEGNHFVRITDHEKRRDIGRAISPVTHVSKDTPPSLIIHGGADKLVPIQQAEIYVAAMKKAGATAELVVRPGQGHGWKDLNKDLELFASWFDRHLRGEKKVEGR